MNAQRAKRVRFCELIKRLTRGRPWSRRWYSARSFAPTMDDGADDPANLNDRVDVGARAEQAEKNETFAPGDEPACTEPGAVSERRRLHQARGTSLQRGVSSNRAA